MISVHLQPIIVAFGVEIVDIQYGVLQGLNVTGIHVRVIIWIVGGLEAVRGGVIGAGPGADCECVIAIAC